MAAVTGREKKLDEYGGLLGGVARSSGSVAARAAKTKRRLLAPRLAPEK